MSGLSDRTGVAAAWVAKAANDLLNAEHTLTLQDNCPFDTVCFHAQQCVEKCVKGLLAHAGVDPPRTHDIRRLARLLPAAFELPMTLEEQDALSDYAVAARYPGESDDLSREDAMEAVATARRVCSVVTSHLAMA